jgi:hypothetical protein
LTALHARREEGIATVAIALVRPQAEHTRPPRALWVPFELGRPFGPPSDPAFQKRVILAALRLLEAPEAAGPVLLADFPQDDPRETPDPNWRAPIPDPHPPPALAEALLTEIAALQPAYERSRTVRGRSTVGLIELAPEKAAAYVAAWLRGVAPASPVADMSPILALRFAIDDLKAYALEAAMADGGRPSSRQLGDWLWNDSATGAAIRELRRRFLAGEDERAKQLAGMFLVPGVRVAQAA